MPDNDEQVIDLERETRSSITLKRSAKLEPYWECKYYFPAGQEDQAIITVEHIDAEMMRRFYGAKP